MLLHDAVLDSRELKTPLLPFRMLNYCLHCGGLQVHNHYSMNNISFSRVTTLTDHIHKRAFYRSRFAEKLTPRVPAVLLPVVFGQITVVEVIETGCDDHNDDCQNPGRFPHSGV